MNPCTLSSSGKLRRWSLVCGILAVSLNLVALPIITDISQTGGIDTKPPKFTGQTFDHPNLGAGYTVPFFAEDVAAFNDRTHQWNGAAVDLPLPDYLVGGEYIMLANDNRGNDQLATTVTISQPSLVYLLVDNRLGGAGNATPPTLGDTREAGMGWMLLDGWTPVQNGLNRTGDPEVPDEVAVDEGAGGVGPGVALNQWSSVYVKAIDAGTFTLYQANNPGQNMYGVVVKPVPSTPAVTGQSADLRGFTLRVADGSQTAMDNATIAVTLNGQPVDVTSTREGSVTTIRHTPTAPFPPESSHRVVLTFSDTGTPPAQTEHVFPFTIAYYGVIPASYALATPPTNPGWVVSRVHQIEAARGPGDGNSTANAEMQLADGMVDATGNPRPNIAEFPGPLNIGGDPSIDIWWTPYVNWERAGGQINATGAQPDNFNTVEPPGEPGTAVGAYSNYFTPGVELGSTAEPENYVVETVAYIQLAAGLHRWGVNSDDGFKVTVAPGQPSPLGITLGEFSGGRGAADTIFDFLVEQAGFYPIRLLYWQGGGGASAEWFSVDLATGQKILIGDTQYYPNRAYPAFRNGQGRARVSTLRPSSGFTGTQPTGPIFAQITDGRTTASNARLLINGQQVATGTKAGTVTTINYTPETPLALGTTFSGQIVYDESGQTEPITHNFTFTTRILQLADLPANSFWIEAEDFDYGSGQSVPAASTMPYAGGAYQGLNPVLNVDYLDTETGQFVDGAFTDGVSNYRGDSRTGTNPILSNISNETGGNLAMSRPGGFTMTTNYKIGWVGGADWWNYTRNIPAGNYRAMAAQSIDGGTGNLMTSTLHRVTSGAGTPTQTTALLGTFRGTGSTGWSQNALIPLLTNNTEGAPAAILQLPGGPVTLRWQGGAGDLDWMVLIPTTDLPPVDDPEITSITIGTDGRIRIAWEGTGTLQSTADLPASTWTDITGTSPAEIDPPASGRAFYRVRQ
jgi:hypothetical protein